MCCKQLLTATKHSSYHSPNTVASQSKFCCGVALPCHTLSILHAGSDRWGAAFMFRLLHLLNLRMFFGRTGSQLLLLAFQHSSSSIQYVARRWAAANRGVRIPDSLASLAWIDYYEAIALCLLAANAQEGIDLLT